MVANLVVLLQNEKGWNMVQKKCQDANLDTKILERLIGTQLDQTGKQRRRGLFSDFDEIFGSIEGEGEG